MRLADIEISGLTLGTAQFGMNYGMANVTGQPTYETARDIIACACEGGVNCLDTAAEYGTSEEVVGRALKELKLRDRVVVATKLPHVKQSFSSAQEADDFVEKAVHCSLQRLQIDVLPICLFHRAQDCCYVGSLLKMKEKGLIRHIGVSLYTPEEALSALDVGSFDVIQIPLNILDKRFAAAGVFQKARRQGVALFARSVYLQGLLLLPEDSIIPELQEVIPVRRQLEQVARDEGMSLAELAIRHVSSTEGITSVLVGVETVEQIEQNRDLAAGGRLNQDIMNTVSRIVPAFSKRILVTYHWPEPYGQRKVMRRKAADNPYLHKDFHGALSCAIEYLNENYGEEAVRQYLRDFARTFYTSLTAKLKEEGLGALKDHFEKVYRIEEAEAEFELAGDELIVRVPACPAVMHMRRHHYPVARLFHETTRVVNEQICEGTDFDAELVEYDPETGRSVQRFYRRNT